MPRGLTLLFGGAILVLALAVAALTIYRPPRASYTDVAPEPVGRPAAAAPLGVAATSAPIDVAPTVAANSTLTFSGQAIVVAADVFSPQQQIARDVPIIISFAAQSDAMQGLCAETGGVLDSGLCAIRSLTVASIDDAGVRIALTAQQSQALGRVRDAGVALTVARDNAALMATPAAQEPAVLVTTSMAAATLAATAAPAIVASTSAQQSQLPASFVDGLPLIPIAIGVVLVVACIAGGVLLLRHRRGGAALARPAAPFPKPGLPTRNRTGAAPGAPGVPGGLSLNLGGVTVQPLLDDDDAIAQSAPRVVAQSFESVLQDDDPFAPASTGVRLAVSAAGSVGGALADTFVLPDDQLFASDDDRSPQSDLLGQPGKNNFGSAISPLLPSNDDVFGFDNERPAESPAQAAATPWGELDGRAVFRTPARLEGVAGGRDDLPAEPIAAMAEPTVPRLGDRLPPAREPGALPPTAALDRQAALQWVNTTTR